MKSKQLSNIILHNKAYEPLILRIEDICSNTSIFNSFKVLGFVSIFEQSIIEDMIKLYDGVDVDFVSNIIDAEKKLASIKVDYYKRVSPALIKIDYPYKYETISHRDVLGTLLSLGIKREYLGDIIVANNCIYFETTNELVDFICDNINKIKNVKVKLSSCNDEVIRVINFHKDAGFVKSLRLDNIVKLITKLSNQKVREYLLANNVKINQIVCSDFSKVCSNNIELSLKGYGRYKIVVDESKKSKKDNYYLEYHKFI